MDDTKYYTERENRDRDEIIRDLDSNIFVEAGAGAGKTSILVSRILNQLKTGRAKAEEIVAITFTNKASQELKSRIGKKVREVLHNTPEGTSEYNNLKTALYDLDRMQISTIHSFCYRLLMEQTFTASMRMDMEMMEDDKAENEKAVFFREWYKSVDYDKIAFVKNNFAGGHLFSVLCQAFSSVCELPEDTEIYYDRSMLKFTLQDFKKEALRAKDILSDIIINELSELAGPLEITCDDLANNSIFLSDFKKAYLVSQTNPIEYLSKVLSTKRLFSSTNPWKIKKPACDELSACCRELFFKAFDCKSFDRRFKVFQNAIIFDFIMPARNEYRKNHSSRYVTNDILLEKARNLVVNHPEAREYFRRKFKCIYVDEFQDTDHVQTDLIWSLCSDDSGELYPGSLFVVGDPKQSIYRFRGADLPLYFSVKDRMSFKRGCRIFSLSHNFRSCKELISFVNKNNADVLQGYTPMESKSAEPEDKHPEKQISGIYVTWDTSLPEKDQYCRGDLFYVANIIKAITDNKYIIWDKETHEYRPVRFNDFLVLCYSTYDMENYLAYMLEVGIPVQISGRVNMSNIRELNRFAYIYRYIAYPYYAKAKEGALEAVLENLVDDKNKHEGERRLEHLCSVVNCADGIATAYSLSRHLEYFLDKDIPVDRYYILRIQAQIQQMIETVAADTENNAQALSDAFIEYLSGNTDRELSIKAESGAVRFMNLHKAKGLEGRIVIICGRKENFTPKESSFQIKRDDGGYLFYSTATEKIGEFATNYYPSYVNDDTVRDRAAEAELNEYRRLEYVEATRGMEALIFMPPIVTEKSTNEYSFKGYDFTGCKKLCDEVPELLTDENENGTPNTENAEQNDNYTVHGRIYSSDETDYSEYNIDRFSKDFADEQYTEEYITVTPSSLEQYEAAENTDENNDDRPAGNIFGTVMHRSFELLVKSVRNEKEVTEETSDICIARAIMENADEIVSIHTNESEYTIQKFKSYLKTLLKGFTSDLDLCSAIKNAKEVYTEYPFSLFTSEAEFPEMFESLRQKISTTKAEKVLPSSHDQRVRINGKADLVIVNPDDSIRIIDYKSDRNPGMTTEGFKDLAYKRYGGQLEMYRYVCGVLFGVDVENVTGELYLT